MQSCLITMCSLILAKGLTTMMCFVFLPSSHLHDRTAVMGGAQIGLLGLRLSVFQGLSLGDFLLAPSCPIKKVTLWEGFLIFFYVGIRTDRGVAKDKDFARTQNWTRDSGSKDQYAIHWATLSNCDVLHQNEPMPILSNSDFFSFFLSLWQSSCQRWCKNWLTESST